MKYIDLLKLREEKFFTFFSEEESLEAVKSSGFNLVYVKHQTPEICMEAVRQNGYALVYVWDQTEEICLEAYEQDSGSVRYIRIDIKNKELIKAREKYIMEEQSLWRRFDLLESISHQTPEICLEAVKQNGYALCYVIDQTEELCIEAYKEKPNSIVFIRDSLEDYRKRKLNLIESVI